MSAPSTPSVVNFIQAQPFALSGSGSSIGDTTLTLQSMVGIDGSTILTADLGSFAYGTLEPGNGTQEEAIIFTGITQNSTGTATLTGVSSVGFKQPYTLTTGITKTHAGNSKFILSNDAAFYNNFTLYLNSIAGAGAANASTAVKGIVQAATAAQINSGTATGSTGAVLAMTPDAFINTTNNQYTSSIIKTGIPYAVATGTSTAYTVTLATGITTLASGTFLNFLVPITNATGITLNVNALGAKSITKNGTTALAASDVVTGQIAEVVYDGTRYQLTSPANGGASYLSGLTTHNAATSGSQTIAHGLGSIPKNVRITSNVPTNRASSVGFGSCIGTYNGTTTSSSYIYMDVSTSGTTNIGDSSSGTSNSNIISLYTDSTANNLVTATVTVDATNITLTYSQANSPTGTITIMWEVNS